MSFLHPERLLLLLVVVAVAVGYVLLQRRRQQAIARYTNPAMLGSIAPASLGWRRHASTALAIGALAVVVVAIAQPTHQVRVPKDEGLIVVAVDVSESMNATDVEPNRIQAAISGALDFVDKVPAGFDIGLVAFDGGARLLVSPTKDRAALTNAIDNLQTGPGTAGGEAIYTALDSIKATINPDALANAKSPPAAIVLLSDGNDTGSKVSPDEAASRAASLEVPVYTVILGQQGEGGGAANADLLGRIAQTTGASVATAESAGELSTVYDQLGAQLSSQLKISSSAQLFVFLAIALAIAAALVLLFLTLRKPT